MQTWATRGVRTALVTGGALVLGTGIASAGESVNPDHPSAPLDGGLSAPAGGDITSSDITGGDHGCPVGNSTGAAPSVTRPGADPATSGSSGRWGAVSGDLASTAATEIMPAVANGATTLDRSRTRHAGIADAVPTGSASPATMAAWPDLTVFHTVFRVPLAMLGRAIDQRRRGAGRVGGSAPSAADEPTADVPVESAFGDLAGTGAQPQFGPADSTDNLLRAEQLPLLADLLAVPNLRRPLPGAPTTIMSAIPEDVFRADAAPTGGLPAGSVSTRALPTGPLPNRVPASAEVPTTVLPRIGAPIAGPGVADASEVGDRSHPRSGPAGRVAPAPHYPPMTGDLLVFGQLPAARPPASNLPNLPNPSHTPVRSLPGRPLPTASRPAAAQGAAPTGSAARAVSGLPDLPPVPTLPAMPPLPGRPPFPASFSPATPAPTVWTPTVSTPSPPDGQAPRTSTPATFGPPSVPGRASTQNVPAGSARQLLAELRGLIDSLESQPGAMHPMNLTATSLPGAPDDLFGTATWHGK